MSQNDRLTLALESGALVLPESGPILVLRAEPSDFLHEVPADRLHCEQSFRPTCDLLEHAGIAVTENIDVQQATLAIVNLTRSRAENLGNAARALRLLTPGSRLVLNGSKTDGIDSLLRQIRKNIPIDDAFIKFHGRVAWLTRPEILPDEVTSWEKSAEPAANEEGFITCPGIFSPEHSDPASQKLAETFTRRLKGHVADLGAGYGWLSAKALEACPEITNIDLYEAEALALNAARLNVTDPRAQFHWSDVASLKRGLVRYDSVICNPPFHQGRAADPTLGSGFIAAAARILKPSGTLHLVANRQLPYERALNELFIEVDRSFEDTRYKGYVAKRPRKEPVPSGRS